MEVTDVLRDRLREPEGLQRMIVISIAVHAVAAAIAFFGPGHLLSKPGPPPTVMTISLAGAGEGRGHLGGGPYQRHDDETHEGIGHAHGHRSFLHRRHEDLADQRHQHRDGG